MNPRPECMHAPSKEVVGLPHKVGCRNRQKGSPEILPTVIDQVRQHQIEFGSNPAIIEGDQIWTHAQLWDRVDRLSRALFDQSFFASVGQVVCWLPNCHEAIEAELACLQSGGAWVSINSRFTGEEFLAILADLGYGDPRVIITDAEHFSRVQALIAADVLTDKVIFIRESAPKGVWYRSYENLISTSRPVPPRITIREHDIARLRYTSGTTGKPKAAVLPHRVYVASLKNLQTELHPLDASDRVLHAAPLTHASGAMIYPIIAAGGANVLHSHFDVEKVLECIESHRITTMFIVPTILHRLASSPSFQSRDLSSLRTIMYGGAPTAVEKLAPVIEKLSHSLIHIYGMTEAPYPITTLKREDHWIGNPRLGSIGKPTSICHLKIQDEAENEVGENEVGEIWVSGCNVMSGYWKDADETRRVLKDGWLATGDLGRRDSEGYYWIVDRKKDVIISGGFNVYAAEVESVLCSHEHVAEAAIVGFPDPQWGETVVAFVVSKHDAMLNSDQLHQWCRARLSAYKCPKRIEFLADLPKTSSGKISKKALTDPKRVPVS